MQSLFINFASRIEQLLCNHWLQDIFCTSALLFLYSRFGCALKIVIFSAHHQILKWTWFFFRCKKQIPILSSTFTTFIFHLKEFFPGKSSAIPSSEIAYSNRKMPIEKLYTLRWLLRARSTYRKKIFIRCTGRTYRISRMILMRAYRLRKLFCCENVSLRERERETRRKMRI